MGPPFFRKPPYIIYIHNLWKFDLIHFWRLLEQISKSTAKQKCTAWFSTELGHTCGPFGTTLGIHKVFHVWYLFTLGISTQTLIQILVTFRCSDDLGYVQSSFPTNLIPHTTNSSIEMQVVSLIWSFWGCLATRFGLWSGMRIKWFYPEILFLTLFLPARIHYCWWTQKLDQQMDRERIESFYEFQELWLISTLTIWLFNIAMENHNF